MHCDQQPRRCVTGTVMRGGPVGFNSFGGVDMEIPMRPTVDISKSDESSGTSRVSVHSTRSS